MTPQGSNSEKVFWVVVADESNAIVYARDTRSGPLRKVFSLDNEAARMKTEQLISDSGGRSFDSKGKGRHTMTSEKADPKKHAVCSGRRTKVPGCATRRCICRNICRALRDRG